MLAWVLFALLLLPVGFAGWAVGHYTSLGKGGGTTTVTVSAGATSAAASTAAGTTTMAATTTAAAPATTGAKTSAAGATGDAAKGKAVFASAGCASCHTFKPAGATGSVGPNLDTKPTADAKKDGNMALAAFVKQSIVDPNAYISPGYAKGLMPTSYGTQLSKTQLADLVAFIAAGATK